MNAEQTLHESRDLLRNQWTAGALYWLPAIVLIASGFLRMSQEWRGVLWAVGLATMGLACVANALRCGRVHCYFTGPFFLILATIAMLYGFGVISVGALGWNLIGVAAIVGFLALYFLPERFIGAYRL